MPDIEVDDSVRGDLEAAFEAQETPVETPIETPVETPIETPETPEVPETPETEVPQEPGEGRVRDPATGRFVQKPKEPQQPAKPQTPQQPAKLQQPAKPQTPQQPAKDDRAPQSWRPTEREHWARTPAEVKQAVLRREREVSQALQESSQARDISGRLMQTVNPYMAMLQSEGVTDPMQAVGALLGTAYQLRVGSDTNKAKMIAQMARMYLPPGKAGVELLDQALHELYNGAAPQAQPQGQPQQFRDPRVDGLLAEVQRARQAQSQRVTETSRQAVSEIQNEEFFSDVRLDMADIMEVAANRGLKLTMREAYNRACLIHPEVSKIIEQRRAAGGAAPGNGAQRARAAATPKPAHAVSPVQPGSNAGDSMRADVEAALDLHARSR